MAVKSPINHTSGVKNDKNVKLYLTEVQYNRLFGPERKNVYLTEEQYNRLFLTEGLSPSIYHFTSLSKGLSIVRDGVIYLSSAYAKESDNNDRKRKFYLSTTRVRDGRFGYSKSYPVRICLDGDKLNQVFKGIHIHYWGGDTFQNKFKYYKDIERQKDIPIRDRLSWEIERYKKKHPDASEEDIQHFIDYNFNNDVQTHTDNESEDRLLAYTPVIDDPQKYIKSIDVLLPDFRTDPKQAAWATSFKFHGRLSNLVRIYDSEKEFNSPKGKDVNSEVAYEYESVSVREKGDYETMEALKKVFAFIAYANPDMEGDKLNPTIASMLDKYGLGKWKSRIAKISEYVKGYGAWFHMLVDGFQIDMRNISDKPNEDNSKILKLLTDYLRGMGADSLTDGLRMKEQEGDYYYHKKNRGNYDVYKRINTDTKLPIMLMNHTVILNPDQTKLKEATEWSDDDVKYYAEALAWEIDYERDNFKVNPKYSKNSLFQWFYSLFLKGSVSKVLKTLSDIGANEFLPNNGYTFEVRDMDYYETTRFETIASRNIQGYKKQSKVRDDEIEAYFKEHAGVPKRNESVQIPNTLYLTEAQYNRLFLTEDKRGHQSKLRTFEVIKQLYNNEPWLYEKPSYPGWAHEVQNNLEMLECVVRKHFFSGSRKSSPVMLYEPMVARIAYGDARLDNYVAKNGGCYDTEVIGNLERCLQIIQKQINDGEKPFAAINDDYDTLIEKYEDYLRYERTDGFDDYPYEDYKQHTYKAIRIDSPEDGLYYDDDATMCFLHGDENWDFFSNGGRNTCYVLVRDDWENIDPIPGQNCPYDDYGLSVIWVWVTNYGRLYRCTLRWNHSFMEEFVRWNADDALSEDQIQDITGISIYDLESESGTD